MVEDESRMAGLLKRALQEEGHAVDVAADGREGLRLATENTYGAIVLDVMPPGLDGIEMCRRLREAGSWVPVLLLTARDGIGERVRGLDAGEDDYLVKPFSLLELAAAARAGRADDRSRPVVLADGDLSLDPAAKRAWRAGTELHLSTKEFALLEFFLRHPGRVLTRSQIIEAVWDFAYDARLAADRATGPGRALPSDGQCGPCRSGLPALAGQVERLADGRGADPGLLRRWLGQVDGRGGCAIRTA